MLFILRRLFLIVLTLLMAPFLAALCAILLLLNLVHFLSRFSQKCKAGERLPASDLASIVILNWNGKELLAEGLPSILEAVRVDGRDHEILVVDNGSTDGSLEYLRQSFPQVGVISLRENLGFAEGNNAGIRAARHDIVVLLNSDMIVDRGFLRPLLEGFGPTTFAVSSQIFLQNPSARREETGKTTARFRRGLIDYGHCDLEGRPLTRRYYPTFWAGGGSSAFHREKFLRLGGFHRIYSPMYVEDTDISYQAWKMGWEVLFAPASAVFHKHRASSNRRFKPRELESLILRNQLLFIWKNICNWRCLLSHCFYLPWNFYRLARDSGFVTWKVLVQAAVRLPSVVGAKLRGPFRSFQSDSEVFKLFENPALYFLRPHAHPRGGGPQRTPPMGGPLPATSGMGMRPHVLWLTAYLPHSGRHAGAGRMYHLLKRLSSRYRITLLTFLEEEQEREYLPEVEPLCERVIAIQRTPPRRLQLFPYEPFDEFRAPEMERVVKECLENQDFDLIQLEYSQMAGYADRALGIPTLLTKHEVDFAACMRLARVETRAWAKFRWFYNYLQVLDREIRLLRRVDAAICMTDLDAQELRKFCSTVPIHVVNTGVDLDYFKPAARPAQDPRLVFVGAFRHMPNVDAMVYFCREVLPRIRMQIPETELVIVGSHPTPAVLDLARISGVQVTGYVPDIRTYMANSSVYVVPLRLGVGIRGKILEAWGMSMAVVATSVASAGLRYEPGRNLLLADDAELFAAHVISLLKDPARRARLGAEGRKLAERHYSWDSSVSELDALYQRCMGVLREEPLDTMLERAGRL